MSSPGTEIRDGDESGSGGCRNEKSSPRAEKRPGTFEGIEIEVTIAALVDFARELRRAGVLETLRFR